MRGRLLEIGPELIFQDAIEAADLLLLTQLESVTDQFGATGLAVLAGRKIALFDGALVRQAATPFQKELGILSPTKPAYCFPISCQSNLLKAVTSDE